MPHHEVVAKCPFYERENQTTIFCESAFQAGEDVAQYAAHVFGSSKEKVKFMKAHCGQYPNMDCPYASFMERLYEGGSYESENKKEKKD